MAVCIKLGFVPSYRFRWSPWAERMRQGTLDAMARLPGVKVVVPEPCGDGPIGEGRTRHGAVQSLDEAECVAEWFAREGVDGLVLCPLDFGDERSACIVAERLGVPVFLYATEEPVALTDASLARVSDSYCGNLSMASGLHRRGVEFRFGGIFMPGDPELHRELDAFIRAVAVVKGLRNARVGQIGVRPASFETVAYDEVALVRKFGQTIVPANLEDIVADAMARPADDPRVCATMDALRGSVRHCTVADDYVLNAARLELAMLDFAERYRLVALAAQCWPSIQRMMGISVCALFGRLTERGLLTACEVDVLGALSMLVNRQAALHETVPHFIDWTIRHREDPNRLLAWHCGNAPVCLARSEDETALRSRNNMTGEAPISPGDTQAGLYQFQLRPGPVTICRLAEHDGRWRMLVTRGEIVPSDDVLAGTWAWVAVPDHARLYRTLVEEGFIHHASMIHGDQVDALLLACRFLDIEPVVV